MAVNISPAETKEVTRAFAGYVASNIEDENVDLLRAGLTIARLRYPELEVETYVRKVEALADRVRSSAEHDPEPAVILGAVSRVLFKEEGFRGNRADYYDPRNSCLNEVLDRKLGIPITLSVIYMEVARRAGLPLFGVGMPGHFLLKHYDPLGDALIIDPFTDGAILSPGEIQERLDTIYDGEVPLEPQHLSTVRQRQILTRMLNNLRSIYMTNRELGKALDVVNLLLTIEPRNPDDYKQRALLHYSVGHLLKATMDFERYLNMSPEAEDAEEIRETIQMILRNLALMN